ncbi:MAG: addiction module protein [Proteobacteria bacterium]|nr:addiction module protein [Pseudomonadota bacterium]MBU1582926.1 addiction module protein [Pseudomonadota bacterium]MBU2452838.1 addiction module protein [Pseudomonadota bacterium]MBU2629410.1 addiction module protein [Pseudomonadota bacterium]
MQQASLPLNEMTIAEKIVAMNQIWDDLMRNPDDIPSPEWHKEVLSARAKRVQNGEAHFKDFDSVKSELRSDFK